MKSICIFPHYFHGNYIPEYVIIYVNELSRHFDEVLIVTNKREIINKTVLQNTQIRLLETTNEGYDFGMFYKGLKAIDAEKYTTIGCVNDSNILFGKLDFLFNWAVKNKSDFWGILDSNLKPSFSNLKENYHIQSFFLVFNQKAILLLDKYFDQLNLQEIFIEQNPKILKQKVILGWEIGLTQFFINEKLVCQSFIKDVEFREKYRIIKPTNLTLKYYGQLIQEGIPMIKKRVIFSTNFRHIFTMKNNWKRLIRKFSDPDFYTEKLILELEMLRKKNFQSKFRKIFGL